MIEAKTKVQRYECYKDSGIEWLGEIPEHWKIESFKHILTERTEKNEPIRTKEILSLSIDKGVTLYAEKTTNLDRFKDDFSKYKIAHKGDLVFNCMNMIVGAVGVSDYFGCVSPIYYTYHGSNKLNNTKYYEYLFRCKTIQGVLYSLGKGLMAIDRGDGKYNTLRLKVSRDDLRSMKLPLPSLTEQRLIVNFLEDKNTKIDEAITKKNQQINLLKEREQLLIHKAITQGLNPNINLIDSGIDWIGEIPEHWELKKLKNILNFTTGGTPSSHESSFYDGDEPWVTISDMEGRYITKTHFISKSGVRSANIPLTPKDSLLYSFKLSVGQVAFSRINLYTNEAIASFHPTNNVCLSYWYYSFPSFIIKNANTNIYGAYILNQSLIKNALLLVPPLSEQKEIVDYLNDRTKKIKNAISLKNKEIAKLKEYKSSLINSVVTGKVKVC